MNLKKLVIYSIILINLLIIVTAFENIQKINLLNGKNNVTFGDSFRPTYVKDFIKLYPEIQTITFKENKKTIGYVNFLNGLGQNFILKPTKIYEITTSKNISINTQ